MIRNKPTKKSNIFKHECLTQSVLMWGRLAVGVLTVAVLTGGVLGCTESGVECLSDSACGAGLVCVSTQCVGAEVEGASYEVYATEMHQRLATQCGICHGVTGTGVSQQFMDTSSTIPDATNLPSNEVQPDDEAEMIQRTNPFALPSLPVQSGDSGWRIYLDNLTADRLRASYEDTLQFVNIHSPRESLLLEYGRGEVGMNQQEPHPKIYDAQPSYGVDGVGGMNAMGGMGGMGEVNGTAGMDGMGGMGELGELGGMGETNPLSSDISYERVQSWSLLNHKQESEIFTFDLKVYQDGPAQVISGVCSCHAVLNPTPNRPVDGRFPVGAFGFNPEPQGPKDLALFAPLIRQEEPAQSALIRMAFGEFEHEAVLTPEADENSGFSAKVIEWIQGL